MANGDTAVLVVNWSDEPTSSLVGFERLGMVKVSGASTFVVRDLW